MNKQIEVLGNDINAYTPCPMRPIDCDILAQELYEVGYRRQDEVAREIFTQIEEEIEAAIENNYKVRQVRYEKRGNDNFTLICTAKVQALRGILDFIEELKKKYGVNEE